MNALFTKSRDASMPFILATVFIDMLAIGLIIPVLPAMVGSYALDKADQVFWYGVVTFTFGLANFIAAPILGGLADQYGRRPVLLVGFFGLAISFFGTAFANSMWVLLAVRIVGGAMQANAAIAMAYVADITEPAQRTKRFGLVGAMTGLGFILGPSVGGFLGSINLHLPFFVAGSLALVNLLYGFFVLPESLTPEKRKAFSLANANPFSAIKNLTQLKGVGPLVGVIAFSGLAQFVLYSCWVLYTTFKFNWTPSNNGAALAVVGIVGAVVQAALLSRLMSIFGPRRLVIYGLISSVLTYLAWGLATDGWMMYVIIIAGILGNAVPASVQSMVSTAADSKTQGQTLAAASSLSSLTAVIAPVLGTSILGLVSHYPAGDWRIGAPFFFCASLQVASLLCAVWHFKRQNRVAAQAAGQTPTTP
jgi:MFS transporter, DHA1 family, tetracycline resistance protein